MPRDAHPLHAGPAPRAWPAPKAGHASRRRVASGMSLCAECRDLCGRLSANAPHGGLVHLRTDRIGDARSGLGQIETYRCCRCCSLLWRDLDPADALATWELDVVGR